MKASTWNGLTIVMLLGILITGSVFALIFVSPNIFLNPFPPAVLPPTPIIPSATNTQVVFPPTWTNTPQMTNTVASSYTPSPVTPTNTPYVIPSVTPTLTASATLTPARTATLNATQRYALGTPTKTPTKTKKPTATPTKVLHPGVFNLEGKPDSAITHLNTPVTINVLANDFNLNPDLVRVIGITHQPTLGSAVINKDYTVTYTPNHNVFGTDYFTYKITDEAGWVSEAEVTVTIINPAAHAPTDISLDPNTIPENSPAGTFIGDFSTTDADGGTFTYTFISGSGSTDNSRFYITGSKLYANQKFDAVTQGTLHIRIRTTDTTFYTFDKALTVTVTNVNEAPVITSLNHASGTEGSVFLFTITASDPDVGDTETYSITTGTLPVSLSLNPSSGVISGTIDPGAATASPYSLEFTVKDTGGLTDSQTFTLTVATAVAPGP